MMCWDSPESRRDVIDYIEISHNPKRKLANKDLLSLANFERQQQMKSQDVKKIQGYSHIQLLICTDSN